MFRSARVWPAAVLVLTLAGCSGQVDLGKSVSNRTKVQAAGSFTPDGLRGVNPCALLTDDLVGSIGKKKSGSVPNLNDYSECSFDITDQSGKRIALLVRLGDDLIAPPKQTSKTLAGLGIYEGRTSTGCDMTAIIGRKPDLGIVTRVNWEAGDPCPAANKLLEDVVKQISEGKAKYPDTPGSLAKLDPCAAIDDATVNGIVGGSPQKQLSDIRVCQWESKDATFSVKYAIGRDPETTLKSYNPTKVKLTDKVVDAFQYKTDASSKKCQIEWKHRGLEGNFTENVNVSLDPADQKSTIDTCPFVKAAAEAVAGKLPST
nr:DUF3558 domain-containing protein [Kibdelosporangium sp. MJ126-NF4]